MNYVEEAEKYLLTKGSISHREILKNTNANCSYSTLKYLKKRHNLEEYWEENPETKKKYKRYYLEKTA